MHSQRSTLVVSHISRKTSKMWGTRRNYPSKELAHTLVFKSESEQGREMRLTYRLFAAIFLTAMLCSAYWSPAQTPTPEENPQQPVGGFVPGQKRPPIDPAVIARGKTLYGINCQGCHGPDLRGGDMGGPNLLRSQVALSDQDGELIVPIIQGARQSMGMPRIPLSPEDAKTVAAYVRSVVATIGRAGGPPR